MSNKLGICLMCAHLGDTGQKPLLRSHVVPHSIFKSVAAGNNIQPSNQFIVLSDNPLVKLDASQDQGATPMLCHDCEQRLSAEIERPTARWLKRQRPDHFYEIDSVLLCRFAASVWWRAMISKHENYRNIKFNYSSIHDIMAASLDPEKTLKTLSFRLRRLTESTGGMTEETMKNAIFTISGDNFSNKCSECRPSFSLIAGGFGWEVFHPRLKRSYREKCKCMESQSLHEIPNWDFLSDPQIIAFGALQLAKELGEKSSPAFKKRMAKKS